MLRRSPLHMSLCLSIAISLALLSPGLFPSNASGLDFSRIREEQRGVDFSEVARRFPQLKTIVLMGFKHPLELKNLIRLLNYSVWPIDSRLLPSLGESHGIFYTRAHKLQQLEELAFVEAFVPLVTFRMRGLYRIHFKVIEPDFTGPLAFSVSTPRNGFGKTLLWIEDHVFPGTAFSIRHDHVGNRWLELEFPNLAEGRTAKFDFYFVYQVNVKKLLEHALPMMSTSEIPELARDHGTNIYLFPSEKIESLSPLIQDKSKELFERETRPTVMYRRLADFIKESVTYDTQKRQKFFGGMKIYRNMSQMYERATVTLTKGMGACPDTSILETAILRAAKIPSRTASRWGHIFTEIYIPPVGWVSTSVTPTGIPLSVDTDNKNLPFVSWNKDVAVQTTLWEGTVNIDIGDMYE